MVISNNNSALICDLRYSRRFSMAPFAAGCSNVNQPTTQSLPHLLAKLVNEYIAKSVLHEQNKQTGYSIVIHKTYYFN